MAAPPETTPAVTATALVAVWEGTRLELTVVELELKELVVVVVVEGGCEVVVGDGSQVVRGIATLIGDGEGEGEGAGAGAAPPEPKSHEPVRTPSPMSPKNWKRPCEKSRPPYGQPGHCCSSNL